MMVPTFVRVLAAGALATALVVGQVTPAQAAGPTQSFELCIYEGSCEFVSVVGDIAWLDRTAEVSGAVINSGEGTSTAYFEAYSGSTQIGAEQVTADDEVETIGSPRNFRFTVGDPGSADVIDRVRVTICVNIPHYEDCVPQDYSRH